MSIQSLQPLYIQYGNHYDYYQPPQQDIKPQERLSMTAGPISPAVRSRMMTYPVPTPMVPVVASPYGFGHLTPDHTPYSDQSYGYFPTGAVIGEQSLDLVESHFAQDFTSVNPVELSPPRKSSASRRHRVTMACTLCRKRKIRCDGKAPCANCSKNTQECDYTPISAEQTRSHSSARKVAASSLEQGERRRPADAAVMLPLKAEDLPPAPILVSTPTFTSHEDDLTGFGGSQYELQSSSSTDSGHFTPSPLVHIGHLPLIHSQSHWSMSSVSTSPEQTEDEASLGNSMFNPDMIPPPPFTHAFPASPPYTPPPDLSQWSTPPLCDLTYTPDLTASMRQCVITNRQVRANPQGLKKPRSALFQRPLASAYLPPMDLTRGKSYHGTSSQKQHQNVSYSPSRPYYREQPTRTTLTYRQEAYGGSASLPTRGLTGLGIKTPASHPDLFQGMSYSQSTSPDWQGHFRSDSL